MLEGLYKIKGIYCITSLINGKKYIGHASVSFGDRRDCHFACLRNGYHHNKEMQKDFNQFGEDNFLFEIIEVIDSEYESYYEEREKFWISKLDTFNHGYNETLGGSGALGTRLSKEQIELLSERNRKRMTGKKLQDSTKKAMHDSRERNKDRFLTPNGQILTKENVFQIKIDLMNGRRIREIADEYNVTVQCISKINVGENWKHISPPGWCEYLSNRLK